MATLVELYVEWNLYFVSKLSIDLMVRLSIVSCCSLIMLATIFGNSLVIMSVNRFTRMRTPTNILLAR